MIPECRTQAKQQDQSVDVRPRPPRNGCGHSCAYAGRMRQDTSRWTPVTTERLLLRRIMDTDHSAAVRIHTDPRTTRYNRKPPTIEKAEELLEFFLGHWNREGFGYWAVAEREQPETVIGFTGLHRAVVAGREVLNLYYRYDPSVWRRGYATEGAREAVRRGRELLPELPVLASMSDRNLASVKTARAAGLQRRSSLDRQIGRDVDIYFTLGWLDGPDRKRPR